MSEKFAQELDGITEQIIGCSFKVGSELGIGFAEKVYENSLVYEMRKSGLKVEQQVPLKVKYDGVVVGEFIVDLLVERQVLVELKATRFLEPTAVAQCFNYLKASNLKVCLLLNFGKKKVEYRRLVNHF
jgi:GxxExxY protein